MQTTSIERALLFGIFTLVVLFTVDISVLTAYGHEVSDGTEWVWSVAFSLLLALWVRSDRRARNYSAPFEHEAFMFFAWPVVLPYYLYRTRRGKGLMWATGVGALFLVPYVTAGIIRGVTR